MNTALATRNDFSLTEMSDIAKTLHLSAYVQAERDKAIGQAQILTRILAGRELGFGPWASVSGIHIIGGKPTISANLMATAVKKSGRYDYRVVEMTDNKVSVEFFERNGKLTSLGVSTFTAEDAKRAGTQNMAKFPRNMLFARAMSNGVRWFCPDVFDGSAVYTPEELGASVDEDGNVVEAQAVVVNGAHYASGPDNTDAWDESDDYGGLDDWLRLCKQMHTDPAGRPASAKAYGYTCRLVDEIAGEHMHTPIFKEMTGTAIDGLNPLSNILARSLIDWVSPRLKDPQTGDLIANPKYDDRVAGYIHRLAARIGEQRAAVPSGK